MILIKGNSMLVRETREQQTKQVKQWWSQVRHELQLSLRLTSKTAQDLNRVTNIDTHLDNLYNQFNTIENAYYPESAQRIRKMLLAFMLNLITTLQHVRLQNEDDCKVIFDIAMVDKHMLELYLEEFGLRL